MFLNAFAVPFSQSLEFGVRLMSDTHIGGRHVDYELIGWELLDARQRNLRVNLNGDIFDAIFPQDRKRFRLSVPHPRVLAARENMLKEAKDWAFEIFSPYADLIDVIGVGNHDDSVAKYHNEDLILWLVNALNEHLKHMGISHRVCYGGYCGWIGYLFKTGRKLVESFRIQYHHGGGGAAPVTKGMIDFNRTHSWVEGADVIWKGHKHTKMVDKDAVMRCRRDCSGVEISPRLNLFTGCYDNVYRLQSQSDVETEGRDASFAEDNLMAPNGKGGWVVRVMLGESGLKRIKLEEEEITEVHKWSPE